MKERRGGDIRRTRSAWAEPIAREPRFLARKRKGLEKGPDGSRLGKKRWLRTAAARKRRRKESGVIEIEGGAIDGEGSDLADS